MLYLYIKAAHLIFVMAWMATLLIYPRYKIHQLEAKPGEPLFTTMSAAANRLRNIIMTPSLIATWVFGLTMVAMNTSLLSSYWFIAKLVLVFIMTGVHGYFVGMGKKVDAGTTTTAPSALRLLNEVPFLLLIIIVILVIVRPF